MFVRAKPTVSITECCKWLPEHCFSVSKVFFFSESESLLSLYKKYIENNVQLYSVQNQYTTLQTASLGCLQWFINFCLDT